MKETNWHKIKIKDVLLSLQTSEHGLTSTEAEKRLERYGKNTLPMASEVSVFSLLIGQVKSPLVFVLIGAAILSFFVGEYIDVAIILVVVVLNTFVGFWQEYKADQSLAELQKLVKQYVTVLRDEKEIQLLSEDLVIGDIILLESGDAITADARLVEVNNFSTNEASLTGESQSIVKQVRSLKSDVSIGDRVNMVWSGTSVARGRAKAVVVATTTDTQIGHIASLVDETEEEITPLQAQLNRVSKLLTVIVMLAAAMVFVIGLLRGLALGEVLIISAALAVAAIPESLLVSMTMVLVFGMQKILKKNALVRRLLAAETLGSVSIVCTDKTGTITKGEMQVDQLRVSGLNHLSIDDLIQSSNTEVRDQYLLALRVLMLCNNAYIRNRDDKLAEWEFAGDSTDRALLQAGVQAGFYKRDLQNDYPRIDELPFNEEYKFQATLHKHEKQNEVYVKGAPEQVIEMCTTYQHADSKKKLTSQAKRKIEEEYEELTRQGLRVLALATRSMHQMHGFDEIITDRNNPDLTGLHFIGWVALKDPVRSEVPEAFIAMKKAGIRTVIITGDHKYTVKAIINELGIIVPDHRILEGKDLDEMSTSQLEQVVDQIDIFARVEPKHKLKIVQAWKAKGEVVAMLGDGVNDAPALKAADIGVAVGNATDVARETSDLLLLKGDFTVIEMAIREGRIIFDNIRRIFLYLLSDSFTGIGLISIALFTGYPIPLAAVQILWINLASDGLLNLALTVEPGERDVMLRPPRDRKENIVNKEVMVLIFAITSVAITLAYLLYIYVIKTTGNIELARTMVFCAFAIDSAIYVLGIKSLRLPIWKTNLFSNPWLILTILLTIGLQVAVVHIPFLQTILKTVSLRPIDWLFVFIIGFGGLVIREIFKAFYWRNSTLEYEKNV